jgi:integrase
MAQTLNKLTAQQVKGAKPAHKGAAKGKPEFNPDGTPKLTVNKLGDGGGLWLFVTEQKREWMFLYTLNGQKLSMSFGGAAGVLLSTARELAAKARQDVAAGRDPRAERDAAKPARNVKTFGECAAAFIESRRVTWKDPKAVGDWRRALSLDKDKAGRLKGFCQGIVNRPVNEIDTQAVMDVLTPIWRPCTVGKGAAGIPTARTLRDRIELVLDWARVAGHRTGENPARWRGHLEHLLAKIKHKKKRHAALHWRDVPSYFAELQASPSVRSLALQFTLLTTVRTAVTIGAAWSEVDMTNAIWSIPGPRMKMDEPLRVPLSEPAMAILREMETLRPDDGADIYVFPGQKPGKPMALSAMRKLMREDFAAGESTVHGTSRSTFRDWVADHGHDRDLAELSLAHKVGDDAEMSYWRSDVLERRRPLLAAWAAHLLGQPQKPAQAVQEPVAPPMGLPALTAFPAGLKPANAA